ncbi:MAG TPA: AAA family ATPase [Lentimicrobium sp.]|jgi:dephospho-CoA kinase|nr:AAA family ATPase [Lentimicrobium sp.]
MQVIGITGTLGAGKGTIVEFLVREKGFKHLSVRGYLIKEIEQRNLPVNRDSMVEVANGLRTKNSPSYIIDELYKEALESGTNCIIESIRTPGEVKSLREKGNFYLLAVDADPQIRFNRITSRNSETDNITLSTFLENEEREMYSTDPNKQNIRECMKMADYVFWNNGTVKELEEKVEKIINLHH